MQGKIPNEGKSLSHTEIMTDSLQSLHDATLKFISLGEKSEFFTFTTYTLRPDLLKSHTNALKSSANAKINSIAGD